jgi:hypothetical protein
MKNVLFAILFFALSLVGCEIPTPKISPDANSQNSQENTAALNASENSVEGRQILHAQDTWWRPASFMSPRETASFSPRKDVYCYIVYSTDLKQSDVMSCVYVPPDQL